MHGGTVGRAQCLPLLCPWRAPAHLETRRKAYVRLLWELQPSQVALWAPVLRQLVKCATCDSGCWWSQSGVTATSRHFLVSRLPDPGQALGCDAILGCGLTWGFPPRLPEPLFPLQLCSPSRESPSRVTVSLGRACDWPQWAPHPPQAAARSRGSRSGS